MRAKVKKLVEKPDKDVTKLPRAEKETEMAKAAYEQLNEQLSTELPQVIDLRVPYLDPSFVKEKEFSGVVRSYEGPI